MTAGPFMGPILKGWNQLLGGPQVTQFFGTYYKGSPLLRGKSGPVCVIGHLDKKLLVRSSEALLMEMQCMIGQDQICITALLREKKSINAAPF